MKTIKHIFQLRLTSREVVRSKQILALIMVPLFIFQMSSLNLAFINVASAEDETPGATVSSVSDKSESEDDESNSEEVNDEDNGEEEDRAASEESDSEEEDENAVQQADEETSGEENADEVNIEDENGDEEGITGDETEGTEDANEKNPVITPEAAATTTDVEASIEASTEATEEEAETEDETAAEEPEWQIDGDKWTIGPVELGKTYKAPQNEKVTITFTELPDEPGNLSIEEITLSDEQVAELGALSNKAYDITSDMEDGTFEYDLTLPKPSGADDVQIKYAEDESELDDAKTIDDVDVKDDKVKAEELDHFTIFIVTSAADKTSLLFPEVLDASSISKISASDNDRYSTNGHWPQYWVLPYQQNQYLEFTFSPNVPNDAIINGANLIFEYQRDAFLSGTKQRDAKIRAWDGDGFDVEIADYNDLKLSSPDKDETKIISIPSELVNTPEKINNFKIRFYMRGVGSASNLWLLETRHDYVGLDIDYANPGSITIIKDAVPNDTQDFEFKSNLENFSLDDDADNGNDLSNTKVFSNLAPGQHTITEPATPGWSLTDLSCSGGVSISTIPNVNSRNVGINLAAGENITCTFTNTKNEYCGNGTVDSGEQCDDGNSVNTDDCLNTCKNATCGDGFLYAGNEQCDNGENNNDSWPYGQLGCSTSCINVTGPHCGDGNLDSNDGETCDDSNTTDGDGCSATCQIEDMTPPSVPTGIYFKDTVNNKDIQCGEFTSARNFNVYWDANNNDLDFDHYEYISFNADGSTGPIRTFTTNYFNASWWTVPIEGTYGVQIRAVDKAGNKSGWSGGSQGIENSCTYTSDWTKPTKPEFFSPENNSITNINHITLNWTGGDDIGSGIKGYDFRYVFYPANGGPAKNWTSGFVSGTQKTRSGSFGHGEGRYEMYVKVIDNAGNESLESDSLTVTYDASGPTSTIFIQGDLEETKNLIGNTKWFESFDNIDLKIDTGDQASDKINYQILDGDVACPAQNSSDYIPVGHNTNLASLINAKADGIYSLCYFAKDLAGNSERDTHKELLKKDNTNPTFTIDSVSGNDIGGVYYNKSEITVQATVDDEDSGYSHARYDLYNADVNHNCTSYVAYNQNSTASIVNPTTINLTKSGLSDGNYCFRVWVYDKVQNKGWTDNSGYNGWIKFSIDATVPEFSLSGIKYPNGTIQDKYVTNWNTPEFVGGLISSDVASVKVLVNSAEYVADINGTEWSATISSALLDGSYDMKVIATDNAGNITTIEKDLVIDTKVPTATHAYYKDGSLITDSIVYVNNAGQLTFTGEYEDENPSSGLYWDSYVIFEAQDDHSFRFSANGKKSFCGWRTAPNLLNISGSTFLQTEQVPFTNCIASLPDGEYYLAHHIYDSATRKDIPSINQFKDVLGLHFVVDSTKPISTITSPDNAESGSEIYLNDWDGSISGTALDNRSGIAGVKLSIQRKSDGEYWTGSTLGWQTQTEEYLLDASGTDSWSYNGLTSPEDGEYTIKSHAIDNAGNVEDTYSLTIISDKTIPEVVLSIDPTSPDGDNNWYISAPTITLKATDANFEKIEYQIDSNSGTWIDYSSPVKIDEGKHIFYYRAWDLAGNVSDEGVKNVKVDTEDPDEVNDADAEYDEDENSVKLTWDADDGDIHKVYIYRGGSRGFNMNSGSLIGKNDDNDETFTDDDVERGEKYYYKLVSRDEAGNKSGAKVISIEITEEGNAIVTDEGVDNSSQGSNSEEGQEGSEGGQQGEEIQGASSEGGTTLGEETQKGEGNAKRTFWIIFFIALLGLIFYLLYRRRNRIANETQL